jgi:hypothetical protein
MTGQRCVWLRASSGAVIAAVLVAMAPPLHATPDACPAVEAVAVPGTTQTHPGADPAAPVGILGAILEPLKRHARTTLATYYTPYPATIVGGTDGGGYLASKRAGIDATNTALQTLGHRCPHALFLLTGYSQGADIAGDVAAAIGHHSGVINANRLLAVALIADPSQAPFGQPTIGLNRPGMGFAGIRSGGFGALLARNGVLSLCAPLDYYCNLPPADVVMRLIGHLGSHLDAADPAGSAQKLATIFIAGLIAPATGALTQILQLLNDPRLIPDLIHCGVAFAQALTEQLFWLAGPQIGASATDLINTAAQAIGLIHARAWTTVPALITVLATKAAALGSALSQMRDKTATINVSAFGAVGAQLAHPTPRIGDLVTAVLNAISTATGGIATQPTALFGPTFAQFSVATVTSALKHYAEFIDGGFHTNYDTTRLDPAGHTGTQLVQRYFLNHLTTLA